MHPTRTRRREMANDKVNARADKSRGKNDRSPFRVGAAALFVPLAHSLTFSHRSGVFLFSGTVLATVRANRLLQLPMTSCSSLRSRLVGTVFLAVAPAWAIMYFL